MSAIGRPTIAALDVARSKGSPFELNKYTQVKSAANLKRRLPAPIASADNWHTNRLIERFTLARIAGQLPTASALLKPPI